MAAPREPRLDEETRAYIDRLVDEAPPLSESQKRIITTAFEKQQAGDAL